MAIQASKSNPTPQVNVPMARGAEAEKANDDFKQAYDSFNEKVKNPKAKSALEKDTGMSKEEHLAKLQSDWMNTVNRLNQAHDSEQNADREMDNTQGLTDAAMGGVSGMDDVGPIPGLAQNFAAMPAPQSTGQQGKAGSPKKGLKLPKGGPKGAGNAPAGLAGPMGQGGPMGANPNTNFFAMSKQNQRNQSGGSSMLGGFATPSSSAVGSSDDPAALMQALGLKRGEAAEMRSQMGGMDDSSMQVRGLGQQHADQAKLFGGQKDMFAGKAASNGELQKAFGEAGKGLKSASQGLGKASEVMAGVASALEGAAAAVAAIPFVGPALSAALTAAAGVVGVVGQVLGSVSQATGQSGDQMNGKSADQGQKKQMNTAKKLANEGKELQKKDDVQRSQKDLDGLNGHKKNAQQALKSNSDEQRELARKIEEKGGGKVEIDSAQSEGAERDQIRLDKKKKPAPRTSMPKAAPQTAGVAPAGKSKAGESKLRSEKGRPEPKAVPQATTPSAPARTEEARPVAGAQENKPSRDEKRSDKVKDREHKGKQEANKGAVKPPLAAANANAKGKERDKRAEENSAVESTGSEVAGGNDSKRQRYEQELRRLSEQVTSSQSGQSHQRRSAQTELANIYKDAAANQVAVSSDVEKMASEALKDSPERVTQRLRTVDDAGSASAEGGSGGNQRPLQLGDREKQQANRLKLPLAGLPKLNLAGLQPNARGMGIPQQVQPVTGVMPVAGGQRMAS